MENLKKGIIQRIYDWGSPFKKHKPIPLPCVVSRGCGKTHPCLGVYLQQLHLCEEIEEEVAWSII